MYTYTYSCWCWCECRYVRRRAMCRVSCAVVDCCLPAGVGVNVRVSVLLCDACWYKHCEVLSIVENSHVEVIRWGRRGSGRGRRMSRWLPQFEYDSGCVGRPHTESVSIQAQRGQDRRDDGVVARQQSQLDSIGTVGRETSGCPQTRHDLNGNVAWDKTS